MLYLHICVHFTLLKLSWGPNLVQTPKCLNWAQLAAKIGHFGRYLLCNHALPRWYVHFAWFQVFNGLCISLESQDIPMLKFGAHPWGQEKGFPTSQGKFLRIFWDFYDPWTTEKTSRTELTIYFTVNYNPSLIIKHESKIIIYGIRNKTGTENYLENWGSIC